ncbi:hypothetical protein AB0K00_44890 [Dactylosporangium sp. NPDC049525]|uniref:hypothetical protein n=1 Tax=Dactylosporangium sp. NPDC049525 TaxID=3154730 RepID=UPI003435691C
MKTTIVFVHGTGVRQPHYDATLRSVIAGTAGLRQPVDVGACYWGEPFGATLRHDGASIPDGTVPRGDVPAVDQDPDVALWTLLDRDPLYELRLYAAAGGERGPELSPGAVPPGRALQAAAARLAADDEVIAAARLAGLADLGPAVTDVLGDVATKRALNGGTPPAELAAALARAIVSQALAAADDANDGPVPLLGDRRDALLRVLVARLHGDARGVFGRWAGASARLAAELGATRPVERRRAALTSASAPAAGDIMLYLVRGEGIRRKIADTVAAVAGDVVLLAHSLGGIACVDLLATSAPANVRALVTVGTQASYLHELGALPSLEPGAALPDTFRVPWTNVYDRRDLLSFVARPIFGDRVRDVELDNRAPFPRSHSAYFANPELYQHLGDVLAGLGT